jgi:hypothetical protein
MVEIRPTDSTAKMERHKIFSSAAIHSCTAQGAAADVADPPLSQVMAETDFVEAEAAEVDRAETVTTLAQAGKAETGTFASGLGANHANRNHRNIIKSSVERHRR